MGLSNAGDLVHRGQNHLSGAATLKADAEALLGHWRVLLLGSQGGEEMGSWRCGTEFQGARGEDSELSVGKEADQRGRGPGGAGILAVSVAPRTWVAD